MRMTIGTSAKALTMAVACVFVAGCSSGPPTARVASSAGGQVTAPAEIDAIVALLEVGDVPAATKRIASGLKRDPNNPALMVLHDSITRKPKELLGPDSYPYTVRSGDTMSGLALQFLGNRLKFYQLSRYNGIDQPSSLRAGQTLNIPGKAPAPPQAAERRAPPVKPVEREKPKVAARPVANPAGAAQARSAGLAALNAGQPARAVALLSRAANLDPGNAVIARDLTRARRIAATVGGK